MDYKFRVDISEMEHDSFVKNHELCNLLQSSNWAKIKANWSKMICGVEENGKLVASSLVLIRHLPLSYTIFYLPRGPILDYNNQELLRYFLLELKKVAKRNKAIYITLDPGIHRRDQRLKEKDQYLLENEALCMETIRSFESVNGFFKGYTTDLSATIQPRFHANVYFTDDWETAFSKNVKKALQTVHKNNIEIVRTDCSGLEDFAHVMKYTEERKHISLRDKSYFENLLKVYQEDAVIVLAKLPIRSLLEEKRQRLSCIETDLMNCPENAKKKRFTLEEQKASVSREVKDLSTYLETYGEYATIAGALCVKYGKTSEILYAGMNDAFKRYMAPYATFYECMKWSSENDCNWCNMGGIEGNLQGGLINFKKNFAPVINEFIGEFDIPLQRFKYRIFTKILEYRKKKAEKKNEDVA